MRVSAKRSAVAVVLAAALAGCSVDRTEPSPARVEAVASTAFGGTPSPGADLSDTIARFAADSSSVSNYYNIRWSEATIERQEAFLAASLAHLQRIDPAPLTTSARVDAILLRNDIRGDISRLQLARRQLTEMSDLLTVRSVIIPLEEARWKMQPVDAKAAAAQLATIPGLIKAARERQEKATPALSPVAAQRAAAALGSLNGNLREWYTFHEGFEPEFTWWCSNPYEAARASIDEFARHLREGVAGIHGKPEDPLIGDPIGREALLNELKNEVIAYTPEELIAIADTEMAWCTEQAKGAAREMGFTKDGGDWHAALAKVKEAVSPPGEQATYVVGVAREATAYVKANDLVTVPPLCEELWKAAMLSQDAQRTLPFAVYFPQAIGIAAPSESMSNDDKLMAMRGNNRHFTRIVVPHELIPGHHLQSFMAQREKPYRRRFSTPFYVEGWALYWEMKLWDMDWAKSPEDRLGMLFWRMHRCARITVSLRFHLGTMTPQQMIDYLCDNVGHERANATAEVRRYIGGDYGPLYQCGYMVGGKQLRALHAELVPTTMTERQFNDAVLKQGPIAVELIRAELMQTPLSIDGEAAWKFAAKK